MGDKTAIGWTDHTFNPWIGCERVSPACQHCYAEQLDKARGFGPKGELRVRHWGKTAPRYRTSTANWRKPLRWNADAEAAGQPALVFCASLADVFEDRDELAPWREVLFELIEQTPQLIWQLLTKRPENVMHMVPADWHGNGFADRPDRLWPRNVWIGTTVEDQQRADERIRHLAPIPAPVRFLSCEPLLAEVDLVPYVREVDWVIVGGESGPGHRPLNLDHARRIVDCCTLAEIPVFVKQIGGARPDSGGDQLDGRTIKQFPAAAMR